MRAPRLQVIVVDNGSSDGSAQIGDDFPNVQFIRLPKNFGLTKALNLGWRAADAEYVFFLHDDTEVQPSTIGTLADALDAHADAAAVCPLLVDDAGRARAATRQPAAHRRVAAGDARRRSRWRWNSRAARR